MRSTLWDFANGKALSQYILTLRKALSTHRGAAQSTTRPKPCIRVKAHSTPLPCYGIRPNPCLCTQCVVCVNIDTCNVQLKHAQFVLLLVSNLSLHVLWLHQYVCLVCFASPLPRFQTVSVGRPVLAATVHGCTNVGVIYGWIVAT